MHVSIMNFIGTKINLDDIKNKQILEVGSYNVNGGISATLKNWGQPREYIGVDIATGPDVDIVCDAEKLIERFDLASFQAVFSLEMLEHVRDWRKVITNLKQVCAPSGIIVITTRSEGFKYHAYPDDYWRFSLDDMRKIFADCEILVCESDSQDPGVLVKVRKPENFTEVDLTEYKLYNVIRNEKTLTIQEEDFSHPNFKKILTKRKHKAWRKKWRCLKKKFFFHNSST